MLNLKLRFIVQEFALKQNFHVSQTLDYFYHVKLLGKISLSFGPQLPEFALLETRYVREHHLHVEQYVLFACVLNVPIAQNFNSLRRRQALTHLQRVLLLLHNFLVFSFCEDSIVGRLSHVELLNSFKQVVVVGDRLQEKETDK